MKIYRYHVFDVIDIPPFHERKEWCEAIVGGNVRFQYGQEPVTFLPFRDFIFDHDEDYTMFLLKWG